MLRVNLKSSYQKIDLRNVSELKYYSSPWIKGLTSWTQEKQKKKKKKKTQNEVLALGLKQKVNLWKNKNWAVLKFLFCITECQRTTQNFNGKNFWTEYSTSTNLLFYYESNRRHSYVIRTWKILQLDTLLGKKKESMIQFKW